MARKHSRAESIESSQTAASEDELPIAVAAVPAQPPAPLNISAIDMCIEDARRAALDGDRGPDDPTNFHQLRGRLETARGTFPPLYQQEFVNPYIRELNRLGPVGFTQVLIQDPPRERAAGLMLDMAHAILQRAEQYEPQSTDAFQQVVDDLYDGFLSAEDRLGVDPPDEGVTPPLVKWGRPDFGPYVWVVDATSVFGARAPVTNLPPANARKGLFAWAALGHEAAGHAILHADTGLHNDLAQAVRNNVKSMKDSLADHLANYWADRIDETASDVMGILNMGPSAAIGLVIYFRGLNKAFTGNAILRNNGPTTDTHPADIVRGYLAAETVALLPFSQSGAWSNLIVSETDKDVQSIVLAGRQVSQNVARQSARLVAEVIVNHKAESLENHSLGDIQTWRDRDEETVDIVRQVLTTAGDLPQGAPTRIFAAHVVAGAIMSALADGNDIPLIFDRMINLLAEMHAQNPVWGSLFVRHPGSIARHVAYIPVRKVVAQRDVSLPDTRDRDTSGRR